MWTALDIWRLGGVDDDETSRRLMPLLGTAKRHFARVRSMGRQ